MDNRRTKTNRRLMVREAYKQSDAAKRQRKPRSVQYRDAWDLILQSVVREKNCLCSPPITFLDSEGTRTVSLDID